MKGHGIKESQAFSNEKVKVKIKLFRFEMSFNGRHISSLPTPALIVDKDKVIFCTFYLFTWFYQSF